MKVPNSKIDKGEKLLVAGPDTQNINDNEDDLYEDDPDFMPESNKTKTTKSLANTYKMP